MVETGTKPIDRWLGLFALAVGVALFMLPKNEPVIIGCCVLIWGALIHPFVNFWWIEDRKWRQILAVIVLTVGVVGLGLNIKSETPHDNEAKTGSEESPAARAAKPENPHIPSFPFIMGAPLGDNDSGAWQMMGLTFGPILQDYNCDLKFSDLQRKKAQPKLMANYEIDLHVGKSPKPDTTFTWFPDNPDYQHYRVEINCPDGSYDEDWEIGRVQGQLRTKLTIATVYLFGDPPEPIYSCVDHVSSRVDASTVLQPQDRYVANLAWQPNHRYEFPVVILPMHSNPGHFFFAMKVQNPGCWKCLQEDCGVS